MKENLKDDVNVVVKMLWLLCMLNMAFCFNKIGKYDGAISECIEAFEFELWSLKVYY